MRPTFHNLDRSYEAWAYGNGLMRRAAVLEQRGLLERDRGAKDRLYRLTDEGRIQALGGRDPDAQWSRPWDGMWRLVIFDVPMRHHVHRGKLRRYLRSRGFGLLQGSVWITPDPVAPERTILANGEINVKSLTLMEARPCSGESDAELVLGAWNFDAVNRRYADYLELLELRPPCDFVDAPDARRFSEWMAEEWAAWQSAIDSDPLLPKRLLPGDYLGCRAWQERMAVMKTCGAKLSPPPE